MKLIYLFFTICLCSPLAWAANQQPNVLMIAVDDLNHWVGHLGRNNQVKTPNIDRLAQKGLSFHRAYASSAICNATRAAMMTGLRPSTSSIYSNGRDWRSVVGPDRSLPAFFKQNDYLVFGAGKIFHNDKVIRESEWHEYYRKNAPGTETYPLEEPERSQALAAKKAGKTKKYRHGDLSIAELSGGDDQIWDYHVARWSADKLNQQHDKPFFLAAGIFRPHLPWHVPKKYFDMYPLDDIELPPYLEDDLKDLPMPPSNTTEHDKILSEGSWKNAIRGYLASVTYADVQVGRILDALEQGPNKDNTIVVLWGDHGWHLGEKHRWRKFALWEEATRTPYIWYAPGVTTANSKTETPVDTQSLWLTLAELTNLQAPEFVEGTSLVPLLKNPQQEWHVPAITTQGFNNHAVRSESYRYISYNNGGEELYNHSNDPYEWHNLAGTSRSVETIAELKQWLPEINRRDGGGAALYGGDARYGKLKATHKTIDGDEQGKMQDD